MKYILTYISGAKFISDTDLPTPGTLIEVDRFDTLEAAQVKAIEFKKQTPSADIIILPFYSIEHGVS